MGIGNPLPATNIASASSDGVRAAGSSGGEVLYATTEATVVQKGTPVTVTFTLTRNFARVPGEVVDVEVYRGQVPEWVYSYDFLDAELLEEFQVTTNSEGEAFYAFKGTTSEGIYTVRASSTTGATATCQFSVGDLGLFFRGGTELSPGQPHEVFVRALDVATFSPAPSCSVQLALEEYDWTSNSWTQLAALGGTTDFLGFARLEVDVPAGLDGYGTYRLVARANKDGDEATYWTYASVAGRTYYASAWGGQREVNRDRYQYVVTTDKTVYTPGETIHLRAVVFEYSHANATRTALPGHRRSAAIFRAGRRAPAGSDVRPHLARHQRFRDRHRTPVRRRRALVLRGPRRRGHRGDVPSRDAGAAERGPAGATLGDVRAGSGLHPRAGGPGSATPLPSGPNALPRLDPSLGRFPRRREG
ncbi:MAG: hypothetical protein Kow0069_34260 [Promethearchaeota archaeon]